MKKITPIEFKKLDSGDFAVRWSNTPKKWNVIKKEDKLMAEFIIFFTLSA